MSLVGRLEDLGLGEILQIVALSGKSGVLHIRSHEKIGKIFFFKGKVVSAYSDVYRVNLGGMLVHKGYISADVVKAALKKQKELKSKKKLGTILVEEYGLTKEKIEECVTEAIEKSVFSLFYWMEGEFQFQLTEDIQCEDISIDVLQYDLQQIRGLNPQFLAMEGTRILDECKRDGIAPQEMQEIVVGEEVAEKPAVQPETGAQAGRTAGLKDATILLVDDFSSFRTAVKKYLEDKKYTVVAAESVAEGRQKIEELKRAGTFFVLVTALFMPRTDDQGILGGLELIQSLDAAAGIPVVVFSEYTIPDAADALKPWGPVFIKRIRRTLLTKENAKDELQAFAAALEKTLLTHVVPRAPQEPEKSTPWDKELKEEFNISETTGAVTTTPGLVMLKSMVSELSQCESGNEITLMILRLASEIVPRGVVFAIKNDRLQGLGQFGLEKFLKEPLKTVKTLTVPIANKIKEVIDTQAPFKGTPTDDETFALIFDKLGGKRPTEVFLSLITSGNKPVVLFYGDNLPSLSVIRETDALEIFFTQAGFTMERLMQETR